MFRGVSKTFAISWCFTELLLDIIGGVQIIKRSRYTRESQVLVVIIDKVNVTSDNNDFRDKRLIWKYGDDK